ncbi:MAG: bifunctional aldolase/short-chain dehydrogenase [Alphaproteobacteria bacterium]|nr:bifunctional aldolase/short-chain dehydrogenase [Alphaproteobacteria bacterium]
MQNLWSNTDAEATVIRYAAQGIGRDLALRVYTTRLLGSDPRMVLHVGGNTSVKTTVRDLLGETVPVLCVKGSGWDMGGIEPAGLPAVRLEPLRRLLALDSLTDEAMVDFQRGNLLDSTAPNPSVETLLHAFLPDKFIDHTHANAVLALVDQPDGAALCRELYGSRMAVVPYIMPGFALAKAAYEIYRANPGAEGLILLKHGIFTFGDSARQAYDRMIEMVTLAETRIKAAPAVVRRTVPATVVPATASVAQVAPILRGLLSWSRPDAEDVARMILDFRTSREILDYGYDKALCAASQRGTATPDHVIRIKRKPLVVPTPATGALDAFRAAVRAVVDTYIADYQASFAHHNALEATPRQPLDPIPRVILVPGLGLFGLGASVKDAAVAADLAEANISVITDAEHVGRFVSVTEAESFAMEYWSLEQAKLGKTAEKPLARHVVVVTGGGSGIGAATTAAFTAAGAVVAVLDRDEGAAKVQAARIKGLGLACDVTDAAQVRAAFDQVCATYGGVDIVVSNAGAAWQGRIGEVEESLLRQSFELNFWSHQTVCQNAVRIMRDQGTGGCLLFNTSKQAVNPGPDFGPYGLPKAATLFLMRQYAVDHGRHGIRANAVNADRIRSGLLTDAMIASRSKARGLSEYDYMAGNLLGREITAQDVAQAFVHLALARGTTAAVMTVDGGNIAAALR